MPYIGFSPGMGTRDRFIYTATASQTTFSGADDNGKTLRYDSGDFVDVYLNGILLVPVTDYTATSLTSIVLTQAASVNDTLEVLSLQAVTVADTVSKANGGTFEDSIGIGITPTAKLHVNVGTTSNNLKGVLIEGTTSASGSAPDLTLYKNSSSPADGDSVGGLWYYGNNDASEQTLYSGILGYSSDVTDGTEDGYLKFVVTQAGVAATEAMRLESSGLNLKTNNSGQGPTLTLENTDTSITSNDVIGKIDFYANDGSTNGTGAKVNIKAIATSSAGTITALTFGTADSASSTATEQMRIDASGNLVIGKTSANNTSEGTTIYNTDGFSSVRSNGVVGIINRLNSAGEALSIRYNGAAAGGLGLTGSHMCVYANTGYVGIAGSATSPDYYAYNLAFYPSADNTRDIGTSGNRFDDIRATNGTIQTSDEREKQQIASLTDAEITAAKAISKLFKTFKWNSAVTKKGDAARTHAGVIAQQVETAMTDAGLNAGDYAFFIDDTWWEVQTEVPAVEAVDEVLDEDGNVITEAVEAQEAFTRTDNYYTADEAPEGATERNRKGIRYPELLSFIGAATEQRLASIESRLDALEAN
jgi:hypothetical protein